MKFVLVLVGISLLIGGLVAYSAIPATHTVSVQSAETLIHGLSIHVSPSSSEQTQQTVNIVSGKSNQLQVNVTVSSDAGGLSTAQFKIFRSDRFQDCVLNSQGCLLNLPVSNETLRVPVNASATYYFGFDNTSSNSSKTVLFSASLLATSTSAIVGRDGSLNLAGLGMSVVGLGVALYGFASKTVIPWE